MKYLGASILILSVVLFSCNKEDDLCFQSTNSFKYQSMSQYDTSIVQSKVCLEESIWANLTIEDAYDDSTGDYRATHGVEGTVVSSYFNTVRMDTVERTTETVLIED